MNDIDRWFERTAQREDRTVSLYACLLSGRVFAYFRYRLRFALVVDASRFVIHVAEFLIILTSLGGLAAFTVMLLRVGSLIVSGAWWGLLEVMRERLRVFSQSGERDASEREIGSWLVLSAIAAAAVTVAGGVVLALMLPSDQDPVGHLYAFLVVIELAIRLPVRVLHSGMFATRRIYRPLWSMFAPTAVQIVVIGAGAFLYPTAAIVIAIIAANAISIWITIHYTLRLYRLAGLWPKCRASAHSVRWRLPSIPLRLGAEATLAGLGLRLDAVAVLAIAGIYGTSTRAFDLTAGFSGWGDVDAFQFFYLVLPLFRGSYDVTSVFYFDFVRMRRIPALREFRVSFFHKILLTTPVITLFYWSLAVALGVLVLPDIPFTFLLALLPLFVVRSLIGAYQIRLFAEGQFRILNASVVFSGLLFWLVWIDVNPASDLVQLTAAMITLLIVHINLQHFQDRKTSLPTLLSLGDWIHTLASEPGAVRVGTIAMPEWIPPRQRSAAVELMRQTFDGAGYFAFRSSTAVLHYERSLNEDSGLSPQLMLQQVTGGAVNRAKILPAPTTNGRDALDQVIVENWIPPVADISLVPGDPEVLKSQFRTVFASGIVSDLKTLEGQRDMRDLDRSLLARILPTAVKSLEEGTNVIQLSGRWLTPIFHEGKLRLLFLLPPDSEAEQFQGWLRIVRAWHVGNPAMESASHAGID
ncbi:MAG: hypothetical protein QOD39_3220 [Mycobacterium sp.]|jgi:hypothetical protein|nr:hypothetical protein [Mycobacterium sp.]